VNAHVPKPLAVAGGAGARDALAHTGSSKRSPTQLGAVNREPAMMLAFVMALVGVAVLGTLNLLAAR
jgi:hypothetical protein